YGHIADLFPIERLPKMRRVIDHPKLRNDFSDQFAVAKESNHRTLRNHDPDSIGYGTHVCGGDVTAAESQRHVRARNHRVEVTAGRKKDSAATDHKATIQLRQFLDRPPKIEITHVARQLRMPDQRVEN